MRRIAGLFILGLVASVAVAAGVSSVLTWTAPTANTDSTAISGTLTYNVYSGPTAGTLAATPVQTGLTVTTGTVPGAAGTTQCFAVTAVEGGQESAQSNVSCKTFPASVPNAPTNFVAK
jgi:hypothetical protein